MPIYGYACNACDHSFDALQKMSDDALVDCPECGEAALKKQLSAPKFRLKGKGWYETDFKTGDKRNLAGDSEKSPKSDSKKSDSTSSATKGEKKTDAKKSSASKATSA